ncbi:hypothetical protein OG21DRAFT_1526991 [Imleria badia]|nr:hypothetical protein OG21DRAFT_1526991 [Imleria badia]
MSLFYYAVLNLDSILYGIDIYLYFKTMHIFLARKASKKSDILYAVFSSVMFLVATLWFGATGITGQQQLLLSQNYPGGPAAYELRPAIVPNTELTVAGIISLQLMTDGLMMHRCRIVWDSLCVVIIPFVLWLTTLVLGIWILWATRGPYVFSPHGANVVFAYYSISVFLTVTITCMICYRLVRHAKTMKKNLGQEYAAPYFSIVMLLVESVLPLTLTGIAFLISFGVGNRTQLTLSAMYTIMMAVEIQLETDLEGSKTDPEESSDDIDGNHVERLLLNGGRLYTAPTVPPATARATHAITMSGSISPTQTFANRYSSSHRIVLTERLSRIG